MSNICGVLSLKELCSCWQNTAVWQVVAWLGLAYEMLSQAT